MVKWKARERDDGDLHAVLAAHHMNSWTEKKRNASNLFSPLAHSRTTIVMYNNTLSLVRVLVAMSGNNVVRGTRHSYVYSVCYGNR